MNTPSRTLIPLLALGAILSGCSCGEYRPESSKQVDLTSTSPSGAYSEIHRDYQLNCDASRNCTLTFKDGLNPGVTWSMDFTYDSSGLSSEYASRNL